MYKIKLINNIKLNSILLITKMNEYTSDSEEGFCCKSEFTNVILTEELKEIVYREMITAQDIHSPFYLSKLYNYDIYHEELEKHFTQNSKKNPTQTDKLAFILLLTYPKEMVERFTNFTNLKLAFNNRLEESDFESKGFIIHDDFGVANCICDEDIKNVHIFMNKYSGINIQLGSKCNKRYGLISPRDPNFKSDCKLIREYKERQREINEGLPIGYHEELRKSKKKNQIIKKLNTFINKHLKTIKKIKDKQEKEEKKQQEEEEKLMAQEDNYTKQLMITNNYKKCIICRKEGLYSKYCKLTICNKCVNNKDKNKKNLINNEILKKKREYKEDECLNCENKFIYRRKGILKHFCDTCEKKYKILKCSLCPNECIDEINSTDIFCNICDEKSKNCIDCKHKFISEDTNLLRCNLCQYRFISNIKVKICQECEDVFEIKENENWKTYCGDCFKNSLCSVKCPHCGLTFKKLPSQEWRKTCTDCYYKYKK